MITHIAGPLCQGQHWEYMRIPDIEGLWRISPVLLVPHVGTHDIAVLLQTARARQCKSARGVIAAP